MILDMAKAWYLGPIRLAIKLVLLLVVLAVIGITVLAFVIDLNAYKAQIENLATTAVGKPVRILGDIDWGLSLTPSVVLNDVFVGPQKRPDGSATKIKIGIPLRVLASAAAQRGAMPGRVDLQIDGLVLAGQPLGDFTIPVRMGPGALSIDPLEGDLPKGGHLKAAVNYANRALTAKGTVKDIDYALVLPGASGGDMHGDFDLTSAGRTVDAVLGAMSGRVRLQGGSGRLSGNAISLWSDDLLSRVLTGSKKHTDVTCMLITGSIKAGVFTPSKMVLDTDGVRVGAKGHVDLGRQRLHLLLTPRPKKTSLLSLAVPLRVDGPWENPTVTADRGAVMGKLGGVLLGAVAPPAALLSFIQRGDNSASPCLAEAKP